MIDIGGRYYTKEELQSVGFKALGSNVKIHSKACIYHPENISIGNNVRIDDFAVIIATGNIQIGSYIQIANYCYIGGRHGLIMEDFSTFAPRVSVFTASDDYSGTWMTNPMVPSEYTGGTQGQIVVKKHAIIGAGSVLLPNITIEEGTSVGALSLIKESTLPWSIYSGIPAIKKSERKKDLLIHEQIMNNLDTE